MNKHTESLISNEPCCLICGTTRNLHKHHLCSGYGRRELSERYGLWVYLCADHHNMSPYGVHNDKAFDLTLRKMGQQAWEQSYGTREEFIKIFGRSWL